MYRGGYIYILTNKSKSTIYIGVTSDLKLRSLQHKMHHFQNSFSHKYNTVLLVYYEGFERIEDAIFREKQLKKWSRAKKEALINMKNKHRNDLFDEVQNDFYSLFH